MEHQQFEGYPKSVSRPILGADRKQKSQVSPKGHEAYLKALEASGATVTIEKMSSGEQISGQIKTSDKFTISVKVFVQGGDSYITRVLFKHDVSEFRASRPEFDQ
jgi:sRNA-binding regulator protein Hfq